MKATPCILQTERRTPCDESTKLSIQPHYMAQNRGQDLHLDDSMGEGIISGIIFSHACHHSYLEEAMVQQGDFHLHLLSFRKVHHSGLHTWEEALEDNFIAAYLEQRWRLLMRRPQEKKGEKFFSLYAVA